ncbi:MAG: HEAT repeat domain-containing protein [Gemmatimonadales bacterium]
MMKVLRFVPALLALPALLQAQTLSKRVAGMGDGTLRLSFASRPGVCGNGANSITVMDDNDEWQGGCEHGPVRVSLQVKGGKVAEAHTYVGGKWRSPGPAATDVGTLPAAGAAADLLDLAEAAPEGGEALISAATLADSTVIWPRLLELARKESVPVETRRQAIFWLGQAAGNAATRGLDSIAGDDRGDIELRKQAVFALSQRPEEEGVPVLIQIARSNKYPEIRKSALFWLGQSDDPRALALFDELLR